VLRFRRKSAAKREKAATIFFVHLHGWPGDSIEQSVIAHPPRRTSERPPAWRTSIEICGFQRSNHLF